MLPRLGLLIHSVCICYRLHNKNYKEAERKREREREVGERGRER